MTESKILLFIVEGSSDETALAPALEKIITSNTVRFKVMRADITCDYDSTVENIERRIKKLGVKKFLEANKQFTANDICGVVQIVDLDGAFVSDSSVIEDNTIKKNIYNDDSILCKNREEYIITKNNKRNNLLHLCSLVEIGIPNGKRVPYSIYYMSCNLDHVLHNKRNSSIEEKKEDSISFSDTYDNPKMFEEFFNDESIKINGSYTDTWNYVQRGYNSLQKGSNFWICIKKHKSLIEE